MQHRPTLLLPYVGPDPRSHFLALLPVQTPEVRAFYIDQAITVRPNVRVIRDPIGRQGFERKEITNTEDPSGLAVPTGSFRAPYFLDFPGPDARYAEQDLGETIFSEMESFPLEAGNGWTFVP